MFVLLTFVCTTYPVCNTYHTPYPLLLTEQVGKANSYTRITMEKALIEGLDLLRVSESAPVFHCSTIEAVRTCIVYCVSVPICVWYGKAYTKEICMNAGVAQNLEACAPPDERYIIFLSKKSIHDFITFIYLSNCIHLLLDRSLRKMEVPSTVQHTPTPFGKACPLRPSRPLGACLQKQQLWWL
jgi:hypothetical protein